MLPRMIPEAGKVGGKKKLYLKRVEISAGCGQASGYLEGKP